MIEHKSPGTAGTATRADTQYTKQKKYSGSPHKSQRRRRIDFAKINGVALSRLEGLLARWLPGGVARAAEYLALNPRRADDDKIGSFKINLRTGRWADFATTDRGGDPISLLAYLKGVGQVQAALELAELLGIDPHDGGCR